MHEGHLWHRGRMHLCSHALPPGAAASRASIQFFVGTSQRVPSASGDELSLSPSDRDGTLRRPLLSPLSFWSTDGRRRASLADAASAPPPVFLSSFALSGWTVLTSSSPPSSRCPPTLSRRVLDSALVDLARISARRSFEMVGLWR